MHYACLNSAASDIGDFTACLRLKSIRIDVEVFPRNGLDAHNVWYNLTEWLFKPLASPRDNPIESLDIHIDATNFFKSSFLHRDGHLDLHDTSFTDEADHMCNGVLSALRA